MKSVHRTPLILLLSGTLLTACGGGSGGGGDGPRGGGVDLSSKAGIARELLVFSSVVVPSLDEVDEVGQDTRAVAKASEACGAGTIDSTSGSRDETFAFFDSAVVSVDFDRIEANNCLNSFEGMTSVTDGVSESGGGADAQDRYYDFATFGSGATPFRTRFINNAQATDVDLLMLGRMESRQDATADDVRLSLQMDIDALTQGEANSVEIAFGDAETFFQIETQLASDAVRLNGPIEYSANHCVGGRVDYETVTPITFDNDDDFASGTLRLSANDVTVELTFNGDTISYQVVGGESGVITAADLLDVEGC